MSSNNEYASLRNKLDVKLRCGISGASLLPKIHSALSYFSLKMNEFAITGK